MFRTLALSRSFAPLADRVLVRRSMKEAKTASGIILPSDEKKNSNEGEVVATGPGMKDVSGTLHPLTLKTGDKVLLSEYGGTKVKINDEEMFLYREDDILGKFD